MPYADSPHAFWSGYFSSRPALKGYIRDTSTVFQVGKQMQAVVAGGAEDTSAANPLFRLERALAIAQHHDAVSGTSKQAVAYEYARRLADGRADAGALLSSSLANLTGYAASPFLTCDLSNATICPALEGGTPALLAVWNQQSARRVGVNVRVPVGLPPGVASYAVLDASASPLPAQLLPLSDVDTHLRSAYYAYTGNGAPVSWLTFTAPALPAMGYAVFFLQPVASEVAAPATRRSAAPTPVVAPPHSLRSGKLGRTRTPAPSAAAPTLSNGVVTLTFDATSGRLSGYANARTALVVPLTHDFLWWNSSAGDASDDHSGDNTQESGAYVFRPNSSNPFPISASPVTLSFLSTGPVVWEARQSWGGWASQVIRLWAGSAVVEFEYTVGPIPFSDGLGREVISRFGTGWDTQGAWVSDSNGRDSVARKRDYRKSWNYTVVEPVAGNYVPVNLFTSVFDPSSGAMLSVVTDRSMGGSSMVDGSVELMVHRRLQVDDNRGVGEPLNETGLDGNGLIVRGTHTLSLDVAGAGYAALRSLAAASLLKPLLTIAANTESPAGWAAAHRGAYAGVNATLPVNVHVVTVHSLGPTTLLLRLGHMFAVGEDAALSLPVTVDLASLFTTLTVQSATEMTLPGSIPLTEAPVTTYTTTEGESVTLPVIPPAPAGPTLTITLSAMQIRTFMCQVAYK